MAKFRDLKCCVCGDRAEIQETLTRGWCKSHGKKDLPCPKCDQLAIDGLAQAARWKHEMDKLTAELAAARQEQYLDRCRGDNLQEEVTALRTVAKAAEPFARVAIDPDCDDACDAACGTHQNKDEDELTVGDFRRLKAAIEAAR